MGVRVQHLESSLCPLSGYEGHIQTVAWQHVPLQVSHFTNSRFNYLKNIYLVISYTYAMYLDHKQLPFHSVISTYALYFDQL